MMEQRYRDCGNNVRVLETEQCPVVTLPPAIVYFGWDEDTLTDRARQTLQEVANNYRSTGQAAVTLAGHADRSGAASYNVGLSQRRANAVRDYLVSLGITGGAITSQAFGNGRVTYVGTLPNPALGEALASWVLAESGIPPLVADLPAPVRVNTARAASGERLWFVSNWSGDLATTATFPVSGADLFTGDRLESGAGLALDPWDIKIIVAD